MACSHIRVLAVCTGPFSHRWPAHPRGLLGLTPELRHGQESSLVSPSGRQWPAGLPGPPLTRPRWMVTWDTQRPRCAGSAEATRSQWKRLRGHMPSWAGSSNSGFKVPDVHSGDPQKSRTELGAVSAPKAGRGAPEGVCPALLHDNSGPGLPLHPMEGCPGKVDVVGHTLPFPWGWPQSNRITFLLGPVI